MTTEYKPFGRLTGAEACKLGYTPAIVLFDGFPVSKVETFDDVEGWIEQYASDEKGLEYIDDNTKEFARLPRRYGVVRYYPKGSY